MFSGQIGASFKNPVSTAYINFDLQKKFSVWLQKEVKAVTCCFQNTIPIKLVEITDIS